MTETSRYRVISDGVWVAGRRRAKDDIVELTAEQARYEAHVAPVEKTKRKPKRADAKIPEVGEP
ncbi:MAG: hypothetical protein AAFR17_09860 [Pseudomonadota bacterium]